MDYMKEYAYWLLKTNAKELSDITDEKEIKERFAVKLAFGTAGMRGVIGLGTNRMNEYMVRAATDGLAKYVLDMQMQTRGVVIAYDTRRKSAEFAIEAAKVLSHYKINVFLYENVRPVPMTSFALRHLNAFAGIMITASHNPKQYNGYKVYGEDGAQMSPEATAVVVNYIDKITDVFACPAENLSLTFSDIQNKDNVKINDYITIIGKSVDDKYYAELTKLSLSPEAIKSQAQTLKIVYTPIHGAGAIPVATILSKMNIPFTIVEEQAKPDTEFSTVSVPNPENQDALTLGLALARKINATVVIGTDPDCDRMGVALLDKTNEFVILNGNQIGALLMDYILLRHTENGTLPKNAAVVKTIVTTSFAKSIAESYGAAIFDVLTGFKFIGEKIKEWEASGEYTFMFGYEESFGYLAGTHARDKDAVVSSMLFAEMVCYYKAKGMLVIDRLNELYAKYGYYKDISISITYPGLDGMSKMAEIMDKLHENAIWNIGGEDVSYIADYQTEIVKYADGAMTSTTLPKTNAIYYALQSGGWMCVRPSGTEPKLKIYVSISSNSMEKATTKANSLLDAMKSKL